MTSQFVVGKRVTKRLETMRHFNSSSTLWELTHKSRFLGYFPLLTFFSFFFFFFFFFFFCPFDVRTFQKKTIRRRAKWVKIDLEFSSRLLSIERVNNSKKTQSQSSLAGQGLIYFVLRRRTWRVVVHTKGGLLLVKCLLIHRYLL